MNDEKQPEDLPSAPELGTSRQVPGLIKSTESTNRPTASVPPEPEEEEENPFWNEHDDLGEDDDTGPGQQYEPIRGTQTEQVNDTTQAPTPARPPKVKKKKRWIWPVVIVLVLAAAAAAYFFFGKQKAAAPTKTTTQTTQQAPESEQATTPPKQITTKHYDSTTLALGLDYPDDWKINDTPSLLSVTSPEMSLKTSDGTQAKGYIFLTVQPKQSTLPDFAKGPAVAVLESEKIAYKKPTQNQRAQTYLTFANYASSSAKGWDALYVTGDNGYQVGQSIPMSDVIQTDPLVTVKFLTCTSQACTGTTKALTLNPSEWRNAAVSDPIKTIIQSFAFN